MTLCPILDFANHAPSRTHITPVAVSSIFPPTLGSSKRKSKYLGGDYTFVSSSEFPIVKDEELSLKYGAHSNRTLFIEYGFVNGWKAGECRNGRFNGEVDVEAHVTELFNARADVGAWMRDLLEEEGYWGYCLFSSCTLSDLQLIYFLSRPHCISVTGQFIHRQAQRIRHFG